MSFSALLPHSKQLYYQVEKSSERYNSLDNRPQNFDGFEQKPENCFSPSL